MSKPVTLSTLKAILASERADAMAATQSSKLSEERERALNYYMGDMDQDMPAQDGRSRAVSTDVSDTIEGLMPSLMEIFCGSDDVVRFDPVGPEDLQAAEQETDYVNHVFMQQNPGFLVLYSFIKDALLSKVGIVKVWWDTEEREERETYHDLPEDSFGIISSDPEVEIVEHSENAQPDGSVLHDVTVVHRKDYACAKVMPVPPEEFGIARRARSLKDAHYCFHEVRRLESDLIEQGYDEDQIKALPSYSPVENPEQLARDTVEDFKVTGEAAQQSIRELMVVEHYILMDYEGRGKAQLYRVVTGGSQGDVLIRNGKEDIEPVDVVPFACMTPVIITHRFFGRSIADLILDIQRIKTALVRNLLDNQYLANNPRTEIAESHAGDHTLDDLLVSRPGGIVRTKVPGGLNVLQHPTIANHVLPVIEYFDATREWRTGVTRQGQGIDAGALQNQSATAVNQTYNAAQARMKLIARIFAETGIRDLFSLLHSTIRKNDRQQRTVRLRNQWVTMDPREWKSRDDMTINVGLGSGSKQERMSQLMMIMGMQKEAMAAGLTNLVGPENLYNSAKEAVKLIELKDVDLFFKDPKTQPPPQQQPDPKLIELQMKGQLEQQKIQSDALHQKMKTEADIAFQERKAQLDEHKMMMEHQLKVQEQKSAHIHRAFEMAAKPSPAGEDGQPQQQGNNLAHIAPLFEELVDHLKKVNAPRRVVRDDKGRVSHTEIVSEGLV